jgi:predicted porin
MKKSLLALAVLGAFAGVASAQSSVTLYGTVDVNAKYVKNDGSDRRYSLSQDGINSSQLGFRGIEDLGGGLKASFTLIAGVNPDTGTTNTKFFNRRSTVSLLGGFGEVRLGRDYVPTFWNNTIFDAFGTNGLGDTGHSLQLLSATYVRADNSIGYFLPSNIGGVYGQFMAAASEGGSNGGTATNPGRYIGGRVGFAAGPFDIAAAYGQQRFSGAGAFTPTNPNYNSSGTTGEQKTWNIGGTYDFGVVKLLGFFDRETVEAARENRVAISVVVPLGQGEIHAGYDRSKLSGNRGVVSLDNKVDQFKVGYVYNLSKRTAVYTTLSRLKNGNQSTLGVAGGSSSNPYFTSPTLTQQTQPNGKSQGAEFGVRHFF